MADDLVSALRALANHWAMKARDYARAAKEEGATESQANYNRGFAEGYYRAATELAALVTEQGSARDPQPRAVSSSPLAGAPPAGAPPAGASPARPAVTPPAPPATKPAALAPPPVPPKPQVVYASITVGEALSVLEFAGLAARDVTQNKDNSFRAIFSRWENMMPHERITRIQKADNRVVIISSGKMESHDHYVEFAFKETPSS